MLNRKLRQFVLLLALCFCLNSCSTETKHLLTKPVEEKPQVIQVVPVELLQLKRRIEIPGELRAFQNVAVEAKEQGYISWIGVDRGSKLRLGDKILTIFCPEIEERVKEEESKYSSAVASLRKGEAALDSTKSKLVEAQARLDADKLTLQRLNDTVAKMAGSVALNDIDVQSKTVESDNARVESMRSEIKSSEALVAADKSNVAAALNVVKTVRSLRSYLTVTAPFDGMITERNVHVGSMVGPSESKDLPLVRIQERKTLRLVVAVPEDSVAGLRVGEQVAFRVPAYIDENFHGKVARPAHVIDISTRTMPVELSVDNADGRLEPGMFATVIWPVSRSSKTLFVPASAVSTNLQGSYVDRIRNDVAEKIEIQKGQPMGEKLEIVGNIKAGDLVAAVASDELKTGTHLIARELGPHEVTKN